MGECVAEGDDDPWEGVPKRLESWEFVDGTIVPPLAGASDAARAFGAGWDAFPKFPKFPKCLCNTLGINDLRVGHSFSRASVVPEKKLREEALRFVTAASDRRMWSGGGDDNLWEALPKRLGGLGILGIVAKRLGICRKIDWEKAKFYIQTSPLSSA